MAAIADPECIARAAYSNIVFGASVLCGGTLAVEVLAITVSSAKSVQQQT